MVKIPWLTLAAEVLDRLPLERWIVRSRDDTKDREDLKEILEGAEAHTEARPRQTEHKSERMPTETEEYTGNETEPRQPAEMPKVELKSSSGKGPTAEETVAYQNMEIGKALYQMEKHFTQKIKIFGKPCDCGMKTLGLGIIGDAEETIPMVSNPEVYYRLIEWVNEVLPKSTLEASASGLYENEYPLMSRQARDFRKDIMGTLDVKMLFPPKPVTSGTPEIAPVVSEEEKEEIRKLAHEKIDQAIE